MTGFIEVRTTTAGSEEAEALAGALLSERLAACVHVWPVSSRYVWRGALERAEEQLLSIRTRSELFGAVQARILELHSYETPEVIALPLIEGSPAYLQWLAESTGPA